MLITNLKRLQNKILRHINNVDRYVRIRRLHDLLDVEYFEPHVAQLSQHFYRNSIHASTLTTAMADARAATDQLIPAR